MRALLGLVALVLLACDAGRPARTPATGILDTPPLEPGTPMPVSQVAEESTAWTPALWEGRGSIQERTFYSAALGQHVTYLIYVPEGYDSSPRRYPTLYMLHGVAGDRTEWILLGAAEAADRLMADGAVQPMLIVFPEGDASYYVNNPKDGRRWQDYLVQDLVADVDASYRTRAEPDSRAIGGLSMGADGALQIAMRWPDVFGVAGGHSPSTRLSFQHAPANVYSDEDHFLEHNPYWLAQHAPGAGLVKIWIDVGDGDPWQWNAAAIQAALAARGIEHEFHLWPGGHDGDYWTANLDHYLDYYSRTLVSDDGTTDESADD